ncbi:MAG TPA: anti-sigma factor [Sphingopyxis sp.]|nr:anti-sigma factor [Sphingopyxis sp.]HMP44438.1 anti-sigma factor [Sphingopyxis sp.]HMQ17796.1 anti-sigma factor [Sphingopyxis sp.]
MTRSVSEAELDAYVDDQLDLEGRFAVEDHLRRHPELAARVMGDLGRRSALRLLGRAERPAPARLTALMAGLHARRPRWRRWLPAGGLSVAAAIAAFLVVEMRGPPDYVDYALTSHRVAQMRAGMESQVEIPRFDAREIESSTDIALPGVPAGWRITDVQLFPTDKGPALLVAVTTQEGDPMSLFALRERTGAPERPDAIREGAQSVAYWRRGDMSYALVGDAEPGALDATAEALVRTWS